MNVALTIMECGECGAYREAEEIIVNFGICNDCFEMRCPCHEGNPQACPLHRYPDVQLEKR